MSILDQQEVMGRGEIEQNGKSYDCRYRFVVSVRPVGRGEQTVRQHKGEVYDTLFRPASETIESLLGPTVHPSITIQGVPYFVEITSEPDENGRMRATLLYG